MLYLHDRNGTLDVIRSVIDESIFENASVLDIGCNEGFFSRWAADCGAKQVVGLEPKSDRIVHAIRKCSTYPQIKVYKEFFFNYLSKEKVVKKFDIVLCLNVLHHWAEQKAKTILRTILNSVCQKFAIFEIARKNRKMLEEMSNDWLAKESPFAPGKDTRNPEEKFRLIYIKKIKNRHGI